MALLAPLSDHECTQIQGGLQLKGISLLNGIKGRGDTIINNNGNRGTVNIGSTGISLISIGAIIF